MCHWLRRVFSGGSVSGGELERDAVHVVSDRVRTRLQIHEQVRRSPQEVPRDRAGWFPPLDLQL